MIRDITIGRYYDSESVIHRMDPRTKLMGVLVYIISLFLVKNVWWYLGCLIVMPVPIKICTTIYATTTIAYVIILLINVFCFALLFCSVCCIHREMRSHLSGYLP